MHVLGELVSAGTASVVLGQAGGLVRIVLAYRVECKKIELRRAELGLNPGSQPAHGATRPARRTASPAQVAETGLNRTSVLWPV